MKAWIVTGSGAPRAVLRCVDKQPPPLLPGCLRVRVLAAGVSLPEVLMCRGTYPFKPALPFTPGHEAVGRVLDAGDQPFAVGQRVMGVANFIAGHGAHAEEALLLGSAATVVPESMSDEHAAVFTIGYQTAWIGLVIRARLCAGETLLVHGAAGGTGSAAVQLGKVLGARVIAVVRGAAKAAQAHADGADYVVDSEACAGGDWVAEVREGLAGSTVDVVFDPVGGDLFSRTLDCMSYGGRLLAIGFASGAWGEVPVFDLVARNLSLVGAIAVAPDESARRAMMNQLLAIHAAGKLDPRVSRIHPFSDVAVALSELDERRTVGKHVIRVAGS